MCLPLLASILLQCFLRSGLTPSGPFVRCFLAQVALCSCFSPALTGSDASTAVNTAKVRLAVGIFLQAEVKQGASEAHACVPTEFEIDG